MKFPYIFLIFLIFLLPSCTQSKAKKGSPPVQNISEATNIEPSANTTPVDDYVIIGGYRTNDRLSMANRETGVSIIIEKTRSADLSGIEQYGNLERLLLILPETSDVDFSPLKSLPQLQVIAIWRRALTKIPELSGIPSLAILELYDNSLTSLNGLEKVPQLERLDISETHTPITDTSALQYLKKLRELQLCNGNFNINFSHLKDLPALEEIVLVDCGDFDLAGIGQLTQVKRLHLEIRVSRETGEQGVFRNIEEIGGMTGLKELLLDEVISSVEFLANNINLERLELAAGRDLPGYSRKAPLPLDVAPLGNLRNLKYLALRGFELINAHVLDTLPELETYNTNLYRDYD